MGNLKVLSQTEKLASMASDLQRVVNVRDAERIDYKSGKLKRPTLDFNDATFKFDNIEKYDYGQLENVVLPTVERIKSFREYQKTVLVSDNSFYEKSLEYFALLQEVFETEKVKISDFVETVGKYQQTLSDFVKEMVTVKIEIKDPSEMNNVKTLRPQYETQILKNKQEIKGIDFEINKCSNFISKIEELLS